MEALTATTHPQMVSPTSNWVIDEFKGIEVLDLED